MTLKPERIQKYLAHLGYGSRRTIEKMIAVGRISVNGKVLTSQGVKIVPDRDIVLVDGNPIIKRRELVYYWINKPVGVVSSRVSQGGEKRVIDIVPPTHRVYPVGRLDKDSRGLMLLTNDGLLTHRLTHPKFHIPKTYQVMVYGIVSQKQLTTLKSGVELEEGITKPAKVTRINTPLYPTVDQPNRSTWLEFTLYEGKHRQLRRMCNIVRLHVLDLVRIKFGDVLLSDLQENSYREATQQEIDALHKKVGL